MQSPPSLVEVPPPPSPYPRPYNFMETETLIADLYNWKDASQQAANLLQDGQVVALPSETVYGLGASIKEEEALHYIFLAKGRPSYDPLIVHIGKVEDLKDVAVIPEEIQAPINKLIDAFWPGPLTLVLPKHPDLSETITSGLETVAVRMPSNEILQETCKLAGPIAAPSANRFGSISPTSASAVQKELGGEIPLIIDGGACREGLESTIVKVSPPPSAGKKPIFTLLRPGVITREQLREYGKIEKPKPPKKGEAEETKIQAPGMLDSHYAPRTPLYLYESFDDFQPEEGKAYGLLSLKGEEGAYFHKYPWKEVLTLSPGSGKTSEGAVRFYWALRELDEKGLDAIIAEPMNTANIGEALMNRLKRAAVNT